jgi:hypothetical protein
MTVFDERAEFAAILILSAAALIAAWCGYQAELWGGVQATNLTLANASRAESIRASTDGNRQAAVDAIVFTEYLIAGINGNAKVADVLLRGMTPSLRRAVDAWRARHPSLQGNHLGSPFGPDYHPASAARTDELNRESEKQFTIAEDANATADKFVFLTVLAATVSFLAGIATKFKQPRIVATALWVSTAVLAFTVVRLCALPPQ